MPQYSYNNIIITVTDVIILKFLPPQLELPGTLLPFDILPTQVRMEE